MDVNIIVLICQLYIARQRSFKTFMLTDSFCNSQFYLGQYLIFRDISRNKLTISFCFSLTFLSADLNYSFWDSKCFECIQNDNLSLLNFNA